MTSKYLYVPNLIGYGRVILMFIAYYYAQTHVAIFAVCYSMSQILDMFDGMAARAFKQSTNFGAMLDMVTDRCSSTGLMLVVSHRYPQLVLFCHMFIWIDICSHWAHMLMMERSGSKSHKLVQSGPWLLQYYYRTKWFMVILIIGAEGFPISLYLLSFPEILRNTYNIFKCICYVMCPLFLTKHFINLIQFYHASELLDSNIKGE